MKIDGAAIFVAVRKDFVDVDAGHDDFGDEELDVQLERQELFLQLPLEHGDEVLSVDFIHGQLHRVKIDSVTFTSCRGNHLHAANILAQTFLTNKVLLNEYS